MTLQTILFDLDGTLLDSAPGLMTSTNTALARCGCPPRSLAQITAAMGNGMADLIARSLPGGAEDPRFAACFDAFQEAYQSDMFTGSVPLSRHSGSCRRHWATEAAAWRWCPISATGR